MSHDLKRNIINCGSHAYARLIVLKNKLCARCYGTDIEGRHYIGRLQLERTYKDMFGYITLSVNMQWSWMHTRVYTSLFILYLLHPRRPLPDLCDRYISVHTKTLKDSMQRVKSNSLSKVIL